MREIVCIVNHNQSEQKRPWELVPRQENLNVVNKLLEAHCGQIWETKASLGKLSPQHFCEFYFLKLHQFLTVNIYSKISSSSHQGDGKWMIWNMPEHFFHLNKIWLQEKLYNWSLTYLRERKNSTPAPSSYPVPSKTRTSLLGIRCFPSPHRILLHY